jgi:hypothetical protein
MGPGVFGACALRKRYGVGPSGVRGSTLQVLTYYRFSIRL